MCHAAWRFTGQVPWRFLLSASRTSSSQHMWHCFMMHALHLSISYCISRAGDCRHQLWPQRSVGGERAGTLVNVELFAGHRRSRADSRTRLMTIAEQCYACCIRTDGYKVCHVHCLGTSPELHTHNLQSSHIHTHHQATTPVDLCTPSVRCVNKTMLPQTLTLSPLRSSPTQPPASVVHMHTLACLQRKCGRAGGVLAVGAIIAASPVLH